MSKTPQPQPAHPIAAEAIGYDSTVYVFIDETATLLLVANAGDWEFWPVASETGRGLAFRVLGGGNAAMFAPKTKAFVGRRMYPVQCERLAIYCEASGFGATS